MSGVYKFGNLGALECDREEGGAQWVPKKGCHQVGISETSVVIEGQDKVGPNYMWPWESA